MGKPINHPTPTAPTARAPLVSDGVVRAQLPRLEPRPPALLMAHPKRWTVLSGRVVPLCGSLHLRPGVCGIRQREDGSYSARDTIAHYQEEGWVIIPEDVDGPGTSYLREVAPNVWLTTWEQENPGSEYVTVDADGYAAWLEGLIETGKIPAPAVYVLEVYAAKLRHQVGELRDAVRAQPSRQPELDRAEADLAVVLGKLGPTAPTRRAVSPRRSALVADGDAP